MGSKGIEASWAGGFKGREVLDKFLPQVSSILSVNAVFYLVVIEENDPGKFITIYFMKNFNLSQFFAMYHALEYLNTKKCSVTSFFII